MKISLAWLRDLVSWEVSPSELAERLTAAGLNVEGIESFDVEFPGVVVGKVVGCDRHPNADRLSVCRVDIGDGAPLPVVCGASNVREGLDVLFATEGSVLPGDFKIKKTKIRGEVSRGMICSASELQLGEDSAGIIELVDAPAIGTPADEIYGFSDTVFDIEVTPNRPDWLSHIGVAREVAAIFGTKVTLPPAWSPQQSGSLGWRVEIEDWADCPRYTAHGADEIRVGASPQWMQNRLRAVGQRPINNIVDITNYVLMELGQPLHAFDRDRLDGGVIRVQRGGKKQPVVTLDAATREIGAETLVITDAGQPVALAGVMGLANSEVTPQTEHILLESAFFAPQLVRRASRALGLVSESSYRFERTADWDMVRFAAHRALHLLQEHAGAHIIGECVDRADPDHRGSADVPLRVHQVNRVLGTELTVEQAADLLQRLQLKVQPLGDQVAPNVTNLMVQVPSFRRDLSQEVDLIEEIARTYGFDGVRSAGTFRGSGGVRRRASIELEIRLRRHLSAIGYHEILTSTFCGRREIDALALSDGDVRGESLSVLDPHHGGETLLRTSLVPSFVGVARRNLNAGAPTPVRLFQIARVYWPLGEKPAAVRHEAERLLPEERVLLQVGIAGGQSRDEGGLPEDLLELKGLVGQIGELLRVPLRVEPAAVEPFLDSGRQWEVLDAQNRRIGTAGLLTERTAAALELDHRAALFEVDLGPLAESSPPPRYTSFGRFPAVKRDLSLVVPSDVSFARVEAKVREAGGDLLDSLELFDIYRGKGIPEGAAAYGIRLKFRSAKGNLKGKTVDAALEKILESLSSELSVQQRG